MKRIYEAATGWIHTRWLGGLQAAFIVRSLNVQSALRQHPPPEGGRVLDAGCGEGASLPALLARRFPRARFVAVDLFIGGPRSRPRAPRPPNLDLWERDILRISLDAPFDIIYALDLLEHVEDAGAVLKIFLERMRPGGQLYLHTPSAGQFHFFKGAQEGECPAFRKERKGDKHLREGFSPEELSALVASAGFREIDLRHTFSPITWFFKELFTLCERRRFPGIGLLLMPFISAGACWDRLIPPRRGNGLWVEATKP